VQRREADMSAPEAVLARWRARLAPVLPLYRLLLRVKRAVQDRPETATPQPVASSPAEATPSVTGPVVNGFPAFAATLDALRYAETAHYTYPLPKPPPAPR